MLGPALDNMVVSAHALPILVRQTAINAAKSFGEERGKPYPFTSFSFFFLNSLTFTIRKFLIEDFIQRHKVEQPLNHHFAAQFSN